MKQEKLRNLSIRLQNKIYKQWTWLFKKDKHFAKLCDILEITIIEWDKEEE